MAAHWSSRSISSRRTVTGSANSCVSNAQANGINCNSKDANSEKCRVADAAVYIVQYALAPTSSYSTGVLGLRHSDCSLNGPNTSAA